VSSKSIPVFEVSMLTPRSRLTRSVLVGFAALMLIVSAAYASQSLLGPSSGRSIDPGAATAEPTASPESTESPEASDEAGDDSAADDSAASSPEASDEAEGDDDDDSASPEATESPEAAESPETDDD
jgi:hypothetical protein